MVEYAINSLSSNVIMTTIINPGNNESTDNGAGWVVAVIILLVVIGVGVYFWLQNNNGSPKAPDTTNINLTVPSTPVIQ